MTAAHVPTGDSDEGRLYEIRLQGHLNARWSDWFDGLSFTHASNGTTIIQGPVADQAALHGLLAKVRDLGLPLVSVIHIEREQANVPVGDADRDRGGHGPANS
jgi:hypothetical protein